MNELLFVYYRTISKKVTHFFSSIIHTVEGAIKDFWGFGAISSVDIVDLRNATLEMYEIINFT